MAYLDRVVTEQAGVGAGRRRARPLPGLTWAVSRHATTRAGDPPCVHYDGYGAPGATTGRGARLPCWAGAPSASPPATCTRPSSFMALALSADWGS